MDPEELLPHGFEKAVSAEQPIATARVARLRRAHPDASPGEIARMLDRDYLGKVAATGAATGMIAVVPGVVLPAAAALADVLAFTEASVLYALSLAEVHGLHPDDIERRELLVSAVLLGTAGTGALNKALGHIAPYWAEKVLGRRFIAKYGAKQGVLVLGKQVPFGIGAVLGAGGNYGFGRLIVASARKIYGPAPATWPGADVFPYGNVRILPGDGPAGEMAGEQSPVPQPVGGRTE